MRLSAGLLADQPRLTQLLLTVPRGLLTEPSRDHHRLTQRVVEEFVHAV
ncbi:hypothetical protein [Plantibacter sp. RU18]